MSNLKKILISILLVLSISVFASCDLISFNLDGTGTTTNNNQQQSQTQDTTKKDDVVGTVTHTVNVNTVDYSSVVKTDLVTTIENIRETVVDVYSYTTNSSSAAAGSGVIYATDDENDDYYYIVTNHHVIDGYQVFKVDVLSIDEDGTENIVTYDATFIGGAPSKDIAVLRITSEEELKTVNIVSDSTKVKVGTQVIAIGNPLGILGGTVSQGIVSATARAVELEDIGYMTLMQTDAAINSGNSGGGLFDYNGILVGIVNSGYSGYEGLNFAIPGNDVKDAANALISTHVTNEEGQVATYGYIEGDSKFGITVNASSVYTDKNRTGSVTVVYPYTINSSSVLSGQLVSYAEFYNRVANFINAIVKIKVNDKDAVEINSLDAFANVAKSIKAGDHVVFTVDKIVTYSRGFSTIYYLAGEESEISFTVVQYIYDPND